MSILNLSRPRLAKRLQDLLGFPTVSPNVTKVGDKTAIAIAGRYTERRAIVVGEGVDAFSGEDRTLPGDVPARVCEFTAANALAAIEVVPDLSLVPLQVDVPTFSFGDRFGFFGTAHARSVLCPAFKGRTAIVAAQMSYREMERLKQGYRPDLGPDHVLANAVFGGMQAGLVGPVVFDADHMKTVDHMRLYMETGHATFITLDVIDHCKPSEPQWDKLGTTLDAAVAAYEGGELGITRADVETFFRVYGDALLHIRMMVEEGLKLAGGRPINFEVSVDELDEITSLKTLKMLFAELKRILGANFQYIASVAPRFPGRFDKGVDYQGSIKELDEYLAGAAKIMEEYPGIKISVHSGSDKFAVYPLVKKHFGPRQHVKTAGTWGLELLHAVAHEDPALFRRILQASVEWYPVAKASYHVHADPAKIPPFGVGEMDDAWLPSLMGDWNVRQTLHVCFGNQVDTFKAELLGFMDAHGEVAERFVEDHARRHLSLLV